MRRLATLLFVLAATACGNNADKTQAPDSAGVAVYPPGIQAFKNPTAAYKAGLYVTYAQRGCCFIKQRAHLTLAKPSGSRVATLNFFTPNVPPFENGQTVTVSVKGASATGSSVGGKWVTVSLTLPPSDTTKTAVPIEIVAAKSFNPAKLGISNDSRDLSVVLQKVDFQ